MSVVDYLLLRTQTLGGQIVADSAKSAPVCCPQTPLRPNDAVLLTPYIHGRRHGCRLLQNTWQNLINPDTPSKLSLVALEY